MSACEKGFGAMPCGPFVKVPATLDVGAQVVGSLQWFEVPVSLTHSKDATSSARLPDDAKGPFLRSPWMAELHHGVAVLVGFNPTQVGAYRETAEVVTTFVNAPTETHRIVVTGTAHRLDDLPVDRPGPLVVSDAPIEDVVSDKDDPQPLRDATDVALESLDAFTDAQQRGVEAVEHECQGYVRKVSGGSPWWIGLAETALVMGAAGALGAFGKSVVTAAASRLLSTSSADVINGATDAVKEGVKSGVRAGFRAGVGSGKEPAAGADGFVFFHAQRQALDHSRSYSHVAIRNLDKHLRAAPAKDGAAVILAVRDGFRAALPLAEDAHAVETSLRWVQGIARTAAGDAVERLSLSHGEAVTKNYLSGADGRLRITMSVPDRDRPGEVVVKRVEMAGVTPALAAHLLEVPLYGEAIPMDMLARGSDFDALISRDEAGQLVTKGTFPAPYMASATTPVQQDRAAHEIVRGVLSTSLKSQGVTQVDTDAKGA